MPDVFPVSIPSRFVNSPASELPCNICIRLPAFCEKLLEAVKLDVVVVLDVVVDVVVVDDDDTDALAEAVAPAPLTLAPENTDELPVPFKPAPAIPDNPLAAMPPAA